MGCMTRTCELDDCSRPHDAHGFCSMHYRRWKRNGDPLARQRVSREGQCEIEGCTDPVNARRMCSKHYERVHKYGDPDADFSSPFPPGSAHPQWIASGQIGYSSVHSRLRRMRGLAANLLCIDCGLPADDWSYNHSGVDEYEVETQGVNGHTYTLKYSTDITQYDPRCKSDHTTFDRWS